MNDLPDARWRPTLLRSSSRSWPCSRSRSRPGPPATLREVRSHALESAVVPLVGGDTDIGLGAGVLGSLARLDPAAAAVSLAAGGSRLRHRQAARRADVQVALSGRLSRLHPQRTLLRAAPHRAAGVVHARDRPALLRHRQRVGGARTTLPARDFFTRTHPAGRARVRIAAHRRGLAGGRQHLHLQLARVRSRRRGWRRTSSAAVPSSASSCRSTARTRCICSRPGCCSTRATTRSPRRAGCSIRWSCGSLPGKSSRHPYRTPSCTRACASISRSSADRLVLAARAVGYLQIGRRALLRAVSLRRDVRAGWGQGRAGHPQEPLLRQAQALRQHRGRGRGCSTSGCGTTSTSSAWSGFFDGGRVWADLRSAPELDGTGLGLKYGVGGGLRLQKGTTFVLRFDLAWSPDARPLGGYFLAGHLFEGPDRHVKVFATCASATSTWSAAPARSRTLRGAQREPPTRPSP